MAYVLVVDDEESIRKLLTRWLAGWGYQSKEAANANDARTALANFLILRSFVIEN